MVDFAASAAYFGLYLALTWQVGKPTEPAISFCCLDVTYVCLAMPFSFFGFAIIFLFMGSNYFL